VISPALRMQQINPEHWARLVDCLLPPTGGDPQPELKGGPLALLARASAPPPPSATALSEARPAIALCRQGRVLRILQLGGGTLPAESLPAVDAESLRAFRRKHRLPFAAAVDLDALPALWAEAQAAVGLEDDMAVQQLAMLRVFKEHLGRGVLVDPVLLGAVPLPSASLLQLTFDRLLPDNRAFVFYLVEGGAVWTSLIAVKREGDIELVTTHDAIQDRVRFTAIRADAPKVVRAVSERIAPPHIGMFLPLRVWHETVAGDRSAIARALAGRRAVVDPAPPWLLALVGVGAVAEAATRGGRLASQLLASTGLGARAEKLMHTLSNPLEALGLDPWELLRWGRDWRRRIELDRGALQSKTRI
jgi:hypothetical protein